MRYLKSRRQDQCGVSTLKSQDTVASSNHAKAEMLNKQFCSVYTQEDTDKMPDKGPSPYPDMAPITVIRNGIEKLLAKLDPSKASGPDNISARLLKTCSSPISGMLSYIYQQTLDTGEVPLDWKSANIAPLFKKGSRSAPSNYRPVSLTSICCKVLEHVIVSEVWSHLDKHNFMTDYQHGFRSRRSCETQLFVVSHDITEVLNRSGQVDAAVLDFAKAFDKVPHE